MPNLQYLNSGQLKQYSAQGFVVLEDAINAAGIATLKAAALEIVDHFYIEQNQSIFSTRDRDAGRDDYFFDSAENCHCFLEQDALNNNGELTTPARLAINKIGHAMHDLNPAFRDFCKLPVFARSMRDIGYRQPVLWQSMYIFKQPGIGGEVRWHQDAGSMVIFHERMPHYSSQNRSVHSRHAFTLHIAEADSNWSPDNWLQRPVLGQFKL